MQNENEMQKVKVGMGALLVDAQGLVRLAAEARVCAYFATSIKRSEELRGPYYQVTKYFPHLRARADSLALRLGAERLRRAYEQKRKTS